MVSDVYIWFSSEVHYWRSFAALFWALICQLIYLPAFYLLSHVLLFGSPLSWLSSLFTWGFFTSSSISSVSLLAVLWLALPHLSVTAHMEATPLLKCAGLLHRLRLPLLLVTAISGTLSSWCFIRLLPQEYSSLSTTVETKNYKVYVLNEPYVLLICCGIFASLFNFVHFFTRELYFLSFSSIQQLKLFEVRRLAGSLLHQCVWTSLHKLKYFYGFYILFGGLIKSWILSSFDLSSNPDEGELSRLFAILSVWLFLQAFVLTFSLTFTWNFSIVLIKVILTERYEFCVEKLFKDRAAITLSEAMNCRNFPLLRYLGFLDFCLLASKSFNRRQQLLQLSDPGGHPRNWTAVSSVAFQAVAELVDAVRQENSLIISKVSLPVHRNGSSMGNSFLNNGNHNLTQRNHMEGSGESDEVSEKGKEVLLNKWSGKLNSLPFLQSLLDSNPDHVSRMLFAGSQLQMWAIEGLSHIAASSYKEDTYGVVQNSLHSLVALFLDLHEAIEKHFKLTTTLKKGTSDGSAVSMLRFKLLSVTKAAIYRLVNTYSDHLDDIRLSPEYMKKLVQFRNYTI